MVYILTEDKESGFGFFKKINELVFDSKVEVLNTSYGSKDGQAGNSKFYSAIINMIKNKKLKKGDFLFIAVDRLIASSEKMLNELQNQNQQLSKCYKVLKKYKIEYSVCNYVCWEELLLSFKYLYEFCSMSDRLLNTYLKNYLDNRDKFIKGMNSSDYLRVFKNEIQNGRTVEQCIAKMLTIITTDGDFTTFKVSKGMVGSCWYLDCSDVILSNKQKSYCQKCIATKRKLLKEVQIGKSRLSFVYYNSLFEKEFKPVKSRI